MTKIFSLVFDYNITKMQQTGRPWANVAYKNKDFIFEYSAASIATFLHHNPHLEYEVMTDDVNLLSEKISRYKVSTKNLILQDSTDLIREWSSHWYCFWPLISVFDYHVNKDDDLVLKLDNDLTCLKPIDDMLNHDGAIVWKYERICSQGKDRWGEKLAAKSAFGTDEFKIWNTGVWGLSKKFQTLSKEIPRLCEQLISVDISSVSSFPESPHVVSKTYNTSDQVSNCYFLHKNHIPVLESNRWFNHHCYSHDAKKDCISHASFLLKS
jgi:hypothetical protein